MHPNYQEDESTHPETLENLGRSPATEKHKRTVLTMEGLDGPNPQDKAERLMAATGHHLEDMIADRHPLFVAGEVAGKSTNAQCKDEAHPPGIAGQIAGKSSDTQSVSRQLW